MHTVVRLCVDVRCVACHLSEVLAVDGFVGASGNSHHVKKDVGFFWMVDYTCVNRVAHLRRVSGWYNVVF